MKKFNLFCNYVVILLFAGLSIHPCIAQTTKKEHVEKVYAISPTGSLDVLSARSNVELLTWDRNEVKIVGELTYEGSDDKEDIAKLVNAFKNMSVESSYNVLKVNLILIKHTETSNFSIFGFFSRVKTTTILHNDDKTSLNANVNKIKTAYTIWIPATLNVKANSRFGKINMASVQGNVDFTLSNNNLEMEDFGGSGIFDIRFSSVNIGSGGTLKVNANNSTVNAAEVQNVTINSRFSNFNIVKAHDVSIDINNGTAVFGMLNDINASARFSTVRIESNAGKSKFEFNNSTLFGKNFQTMEISARFSKFNAATIGDTKINLSNNSNYDFSTVNTLSCRESRFSTFKIGEIAVEASFPDATNSQLDILGTSASFTGFSGNFRFGTVNLKLHPSILYNLNYSGTFGQLNGISPDKFKTRYVSEKNGSSTSIQGLNADAKCNIDLVARNTNIKIE